MKIRHLTSTIVATACLTWAGAASAQPVTGSGTSGRIPLWNGSSSVGDSSLRQGSNGNLGVGIGSHNHIKMLINGGEDPGLAVTAKSDALGAFVVNQNGPAPIAEFRVGNAAKMVVGSDGRVGIGTTTPSPAATLEVSNPGRAVVVVDSGPNDYSAVDFYDDGQPRWGLGKSWNGDFYIDRTGAPRLTIQEAGNVGIGTFFPNANLHLTNAGDCVMAIDGLTSGLDFRAPGGGGWGMGRREVDFYLDENGVGNHLTVQAGTGNVGIGAESPPEKLTVIGNICVTGVVGTCSDARFKKNVETVEGAIGRVQKLRGVTFDWDRERFADRGFSEKHQLGFIAQEVEEVLPEVVSTGADGFRSVDYGRVTPLLVEAIKEQQRQIESLREQVAALSAGRSAGDAVAATTR